MAITNKILKSKVDRLGELNNQIKELEKEAKGIKELIKETGKTEIFGDTFRAMVSYSKRVSLDQKLIAADMGEKFESWKAKFSKVSQVTTVKTY
jgi:predicted phage-related endonuclease